MCLNQCLNQFQRHDNQSADSVKNIIWSRDHPVDGDFMIYVSDDWHKGCNMWCIHSFIKLTDLITWNSNEIRRGMTEAGDNRIFFISNFGWSQLVINLISQTSGSSRLRLVNSLVNLELQSFNKILYLPLIQTIYPFRLGGFTKVGKSFTEKLNFPGLNLTWGIILGNHVIYPL